MKTISLLYLVIISLLFSCSISKNEVRYIELKEWHILGPFESGSQTNYLQFNNLQRWGYTEDQIDYEAIINIPAEQGVTNSAYTSDLNVIDFCKHFGVDPFDDNISGNAYAACSFEVRDTVDYYINFSSDDGGKVFLNNEEIINLEKADLLAKYEVYQPVKLKKGRNFILVKVNNGMYNWQAFVKIEKFSETGLKEHYNLVNKLINNKFFTLSLFDSTNLLIPAKNLPDSELKFSISSPENSQVYSGEIKKNMQNFLDISQLSDGLYSAKLFIGEIELTQDIFKGDLIGTIKNSIAQLETIESKSKEFEATIAANVSRFNHLMKPENSGGDQSETQKWQRKLIYIYKTFSEIEKNLSEGKTVEGIPNTVIRGFVSKIDNQVQYYISHAPQNYNPDQKYPLVVFTPYFLATQRPYLESLRVADLDIQENLQYLSNKYQMIVIEPFCREVSWYNLNSIVDTDLFEVMNCSKRNYNIDTTRIFLAGSCAGGDKALRFAVEYPHLFAGIGFASPSFSVGKSNHEWHQRNLPFDYIENIKKMPVLTMHSENDRHTSIKNSKYLSQIAKANKLEDFTFIQTKNDVEEYFWYKYSDRIFEFFSEIVPKEKTDFSSLKMGNLKYNTNQIITIIERETPDVSIVALQVKNNKIKVKTSNVTNFKIDIQKLNVNPKNPISVYENGKLLYKGTINDSFFIKCPVSESNFLLKNSSVNGPFTEIFTNSFIIVIGSQGTIEMTKQNEKIAQYFNDSWKHKYQNDCVVKYDYQIINSDIENSNLICVGNFSNNKILNEIEGKIPISINNDTIVIGSQTKIGKRLNVYFVYPNPKNTDKYLGIYSGDVTQSAFELMDIEANEFSGLLRLYNQDSAYFDVSCFGWYDYKIWNNYGNVLYAGYFDDRWKN